jgi:MFS-type transporter involved in bile tolerance (Atg22 family)
MAEQNEIKYRIDNTQLIFLISLAVAIDGIQTILTYLLLVWGLTVW